MNSVENVLEAIVRRYFIFAVIGVICLLAGCDLKIMDDLWDDNDVIIPYGGGEITEISFKILGPSQVQISWEENFTNEDGFTVSRWSADYSSNRIARCGANETVVVDSTAELGKEYTYFIEAFKNGIVSPGTSARFKFTLPNLSEVGYEFNWIEPNRLKLIWTNNAPWADSILIAKKVGAQAWVTPYAVIPGSATDFMDEDLLIGVRNTWSFTTYYQNHISDKYIYTIEP